MGVKMGIILEWLIGIIVVAFLGLFAWVVIRFLHLVEEVLKVMAQ